MSLSLDHIALSAESLEAGCAWVEERLGVKLAGGGQHALMATHNRLLAMGDLYFEVIAIDPEAPAPKHPRWFDLDNFKGKPRLTNWILGSKNISDDLARFAGSGVETALARGDFRWRMGVPAKGRLPFDGFFPALIQWDGPSPAPRLPETGVRLERLEIAHPEARALQDLLAPHFSDPRVVILAGENAMRASFSTPHGRRTLE